MKDYLKRVGSVLFKQAKKATFAAGAAAVTAFAAGGVNWASAAAAGTAAVLAFWGTFKLANVEGA